MRLAEVAFIRLFPFSRLRFSLELEGIDGRRISLNWSAKDPNATIVLAAILDLVFCISRKNPFVTYVIGTPRGIWIAAWFGLLSSLCVTVLIAWSALYGRGLPTATLPLAVAPVALCVILPTLLGEQTQKVSLQTLLNKLADYRSQANSFSSRR